MLLRLNYVLRKKILQVLCVGYVLLPMSALAQEIESDLDISSAKGIEEKSCNVDLTLYEKGTKKRIADANIFLMPDGQKVVTDIAGNARFESIACRHMKLVVNISGYMRLDFGRNLEEENSRFKLYVEKVDQGDFETKVVDDKFKRDGSKRTLSQDDFINAIGARGDPIVALENEAGVSGFGEEGGLILQGADPEDTRFYINGHEVPLIFHDLGFSSVLIPDVVDSVDLYTAGFGSEYGRTIGGNVNLTTRAPKTDRKHGMAYVDLLNAAAVIQGPISDDHSFWVGGRMSYLGPVFKLVQGNDSNVTFTNVPQFYDFEGSYQWKISDRTTFDILGITATDKLKLAIKDADDPYFKGSVGSKTSFYRIIPRLKVMWDDQNKFETSVAFGKDYLNFEIGDQFFDADILQPTLRSEWEQHWSDQLVSFVGLDFKYVGFHANVNLPAGSFPNSEDENTPFSLRETIVKEIDEKALQSGGYIRLNLETKDKLWIFSPNLRLDHYGLTGNFHAQPRMEITRIVDKNWKMRASAGLYYQPPQPAETEIDFGNPDLDDPYSYHYNVTGIADFRDEEGQGFWGDGSFFYKDLRNLVSDSDATLVRNGIVTPERYNNAGKGFVMGNQWSLNYRTGRWTNALTYTLLWSRRFNPDDGWYVTLGEKRHNVNWRSSLKLGKWTLGGRVRYISGGLDTPVVSAVYDLDQDIYNPQFGERNSRHIQDFFQLDLRVDRKWIFDAWILSLYVDVQNVTNRKNVFGIDYNFDYSEEETDGAVPILPTFGVKGEF